MGKIENIKKIDKDKRTPKDEDTLNKHYRKEFNKAWKRCILHPNKESIGNIILVLDEMKEYGQISQEKYDRNIDKLNKIYGRFQKTEDKKKKMKDKILQGK